MEIKKTQKKPQKFYCEKCNFTCSNKKDYNRHCSTAKHKMEIMEIKKTQEKLKKFYCEKCNFTCSSKTDYTRHCLTAKHKMEIMEIKKTQEKQGFYCECGKIYKNSSGLWKHKKKCKKVQEDTKDEEEKDYKELLLEAMKQMKEKDELVAEVMKQKDELVAEVMTKMSEQQKENNILVTKMTDMMPLIGNNNNNTTNNTFNLNVFLNETCKDAMSLEDFIDSIEVTLEDYVNTGEKGFVKGISDIVVNKINGLEQHHRPVHCTDLKRQVLYVKNDDKWEKDQDKMNLRNAVNKVAKKNVGMASVMKETIDYDDTKNCDDYLHHATYFYNALGGDGDEKKNEDEIIKNVLKEVTIDKECGNN